MCKARCLTEEPETQVLLRQPVPIACLPFLTLQSYVRNVKECRCEKTLSGLEQVLPDADKDLLDLSHQASGKVALCLVLATQDTCLSSNALEAPKKYTVPQQHRLRALSAAAGCSNPL